MEKVWLKNYQPGVPHTINPDKYQSLNELFNSVCSKYSKRYAFANMGKKITYHELDTLTKNFAANLQNLNIKPHDKVAIMMPNLIQYPIALFGALRAGCTIVNVNPLYTPRELEYQLNDSGATTIVIVENCAATLSKVIANTKINNVIVTSIGDMFNPIKSLCIKFVLKYIKKLTPNWHISSHVKFLNLIKSTDTYIDPNTQPSDIAFLQYTGGTTGTSKGAILTNRNMLAALEQNRNWIQQEVSSDGDITITPIPLYHIFALTANCLTFMYIGAMNVLITNPRDTNGFIKDLIKYKFSAITGVNPLYHALIEHPKFTKIDFSKLRISLGGGMPVQRPVAEKWRKLTGKNLLDAYGLTEASPGVCISPINLKEFNGCVGLPIPSTDISIRDEYGTELGFDTPGELWVKGPQVMHGYWKNTKETNKVLTKDGWLKTGDVATVNKDGFVEIVDRTKDVILVSGFNVFPAEIEKIILEIPEVQEVAVIGVSNNEKGETVKAFIILNTNHNIKSEQIISHCKKNLVAYKAPKMVEFVTELPKNPVGKVLKKLLR